jgi:glycosyltransferase involved in cell wall biosynthesis
MKRDILPASPQDANKMSNIMVHSSDEADPLVTVIAICYNHARFLRECLDSIARQSYKNIQLIIADDCSRDGSQPMIDSWIQSSGLNCQFLRHEKNLGLCRTINEALSLARGKYVCGVATDDVWLPHKLQTQVELMEHLPDKVGVVYSDAFQMDEDGKLFNQTFIDAHAQQHFKAKPAGNLHACLWNGNFIPAMATLTRRECFDRVGLYDESLFFEDWDMWLRISRLYEFYYSEAVSARYRIVSNSMAHGNTDKMLTAGIQICRKHIEHGWVTRETWPHVADKLYFFAEQSYKLKLPGMKDTLALALKYDRKFRTRLLSCFVRLGVPYDFYTRTRRLAKLCSRN